MSYIGFKVISGLPKIRGTFFVPHNKDNGILGSAYGGPPTCTHQSWTLRVKGLKFSAETYPLSNWRLPIECLLLSSKMNLLSQMKYGRAVDTEHPA